MTVCRQSGSPLSNATDSEIFAPDCRAGVQQPQQALLLCGHAHHSHSCCCCDVCVMTCQQCSTQYVGVLVRRPGVSR